MCITDEPDNYINQLIIKKSQPPGSDFPVSNLPLVIKLNKG